MQKNTSLNKTQFDDIVSLKDYEKATFLQKKIFLNWFQILKNEHNDLKIDFKSFTNFNIAFKTVNKIIRKLNSKSHLYLEAHPYFHLNFTEFKNYLKKYKSENLKNGDLKVYIESFEEMKEIGSPSWCVTKSYNQYKKYLKNNIFYIIFKKHEGHNEINENHIIGITEKKYSILQYNWFNEPIVKFESIKKSTPNFLFLILVIANILLWNKSLENILLVILISYVECIILKIFFLLAENLKYSYFLFFLLFFLYSSQSFSVKFYHYVTVALPQKTVKIKKIKHVDNNFYYTLRLNKRGCSSYENSIYKDDICFYHKKGKQ